MAMREITVGTKNDARVYGTLYPAGIDAATQSEANVVILCDSGAYPGIGDVDEYIVEKANRMLRESGEIESQ